MKTLKLLILGLVVFFSFSCGGNEKKEEPKPDNTLKASDITGTWKTSKAKFKDNSCNVGKTITDEIIANIAYYKISGEGSNLEFQSCKEQSCSESKELGQYSFKSSVSVSYEEVTDLAEITNTELDCKIKMVIKDKFVFSSKDSASIVSKAVTTKEGEDCTDMKAELEKSDEEISKEFAKLLNDSCTMSISAKLNKQ